METLGIIKNYLFVSYKLGPDSFTFLYGGSINQSNVASFLSHADINGGVIGGASLRKDEFSNILRIVEGIGEKKHDEIHR